MNRTLAGLARHAAAAAVAALIHAELVYPGSSAWMKVAVAGLAGLGIYAPKGGPQ